MPTASDRTLPPVVALHCSAASGRQWQPLAAALAGRFTVLAPDFYGTPARGPWLGAGPFRLADEAAPVLAAVDAARQKVHLVGHSYGGAVALRVAAARPHQIASLALYEPCAFHLLRAAGAEGRAAMAEVRAVVRDIDRAVLAGAWRRAGRRFVDYWGGAGAFAAMPPERQAQVAAFMPKASLDFRALFGEPTPLRAYRALGVPLLLMQGEHAPAPTQVIARRLAAAMRPAETVTLHGAGHMGPLTHADAVAAAIARHLQVQQPAAPDAPGAAQRAA